jgi:DNA-directed RNA polymerase
MNECMYACMYMYPLCSIRLCCLSSIPRLCQGVHPHTHQLLTEPPTFLHTHEHFLAPTLTKSTLQLLRTCANHIANLTLNSIGETFESASAVKVWLKETCGTVVETGNPMQWVTPVGLPVTQPYKISEKLSVRTVMQKVVVVDPRKDHGVNKQKQTTAFAPNFVHSLDAAHMMMTAVECYEQGLDFAAVHDSFWTHAGDVDTMNGILRDQFVNLHSKDHLNRLVNDLRDMYPQCEFKDPPPRGDLDIELVKGSDYFFN